MSREDALAEAHRLWGKDGFAIVKRGHIGRRYLVGFNSYKSGRRKQVCVGAGGSWRQAFECATTTPFVNTGGVSHEKRMA